MNSIILKITLVVVCCFVFVGGCQTVHGICGDGITTFTMLEKVTRPLAEKQDEITTRMTEDSLHSRVSKAHNEIEDANARADRFALDASGPVTLSK